MRSRFLLCIAALTLVSFQAHAQIDPATAESLLKKSGTWSQLESVAAQMDAAFLDQLASAAPKISASEKARLLRAVATAYSSQQLRSIAVSVTSGAVDRQHLPAIEQWYSSPTSQLITRMEEETAARSGDTAALMKEGQAQLEAASDARKKLIGELVTVSRAGESIAQIMINTALGLQVGILSTQPDASVAAAADALRAQLKAQQPDMEKAYTAYSQAAYASMYHAATDQQLQQYALFLKSPAGSHFLAVTMKAVDAALTRSAKDLGQRLPGARDSANS
jgi:hypothetical protein